MQVKDVLTKTVASCHLDTNLSAAGALMWESDCGVLPVVDEKRKVIGMLTDRDAFIALATRNLQASRLKVQDVITKKAPLTCQADDDVRSVLATMAARRIRRMPVVDKAGLLEGIVALNDIARHSEKKMGRKQPDISHDDVAATLQAICNRKPVQRQAAA